MNFITQLSSQISSLKQYLTPESITLFSIFITFLIYTLGKQYEIRMKKHEAKKKEYEKFMSFFEKLFSSTSEGLTGEELLKKMGRSDFFDMGASLLMYGSRKLYKKYLFYREFSTNPIYSNRDYDIPSLSLYLLADMFRLMRKELGLNSINGVSSVEALGFFVNNFANNPKSKIVSYQARYRIMMIKIELFLFDRYCFIFSKRTYYLFIKPVFGIIKLLFQYIFVIPLGRLILKVFPNAPKKLDELMERLEELKRENAK